MREKKDHIIVAFITVIFSMLVLCCWLKPQDTYSDSERRKLEQLPEFTKETVLNGTFMDAFEGYAADQFPVRETFRQLKSISALYAFGQKDIHGIYQKAGHLSKIDYPLNETSLERAADKFAWIYETYLSGTKTNVYFSIIPDKNTFLGEDGDSLCLDYEELYEFMQNRTGQMEYIDIADLLELDDYYRTDLHWRQEKITDVADRLAEHMGVSLLDSYEEKVLETPFYGVYSAQAALGNVGERLVYLDTEIFNSCVVYDYENDRKIAVYDMEKAAGKDAYEIFLSGALSLITIENPEAVSEKELILFRDSFGSSLAPLLISGYSKITLVDIRYLSSAFLDKWITFDDQDVLFLYSTLVLNHSETLK